MKEKITMGKKSKKRGSLQPGEGRPPLAEKHSVFDDDETDFTPRKKADEWDKAWQRRSSELCDVNIPEECNRKLANEKKSLVSGGASPPLAKKHSVFDDDETDFTPRKEADEWDKAWQGQPSELDEIDISEEYNKKMAKEKKEQRSCFYDGDVDNDYNDVAVEEPITSIEPCDVGLSPLSLPSSPPPSPALAPPPVPLATPPVAHTAMPDVTAEDGEVADRAFRIAEDFVRRYKIIIVDNALYIYNGIFYRKLPEDEIQRRILNDYRYEVGKGSTASVLRNAANLIKYCVKDVYDEFPANSDIIVFINGTLEVTSGRFRKNSPEDLASSALGISYDPKSWNMPWTKYFLETVSNGDSVLYERILQVIGYILSNDVKAKAFFYVEGVGDAGKSRFCDLIASFFPSSGANKVARIALQDLGGKFAMSNLVNAKLNISEDLPDSPLSPTTVSRIKMISDGNRLEAEAKFVQATSFRPLCKLLFASNHPLRLKEYDAAFANRVVYIPFLNPIPKEKQDKNILEKMQRELPALFNHAFEAYKRLVAGGYNWAGADKFRPEISVTKSGDPSEKALILRRFLNACCEFDDDAVTSTSELQSAYEEFCHAQTCVPIQGDRFSRELAPLLPDTVTRTKIGNKKRGFKGIRLKAF